jgi:hypothetical protein
MHYYSPWSDPDAALARYQEETNSRLRIASPGKPAKPRPDFPLYPHAVGQWAKHIRGVVRHVGPWADPEAALAGGLQQKDDLYAGRKPSDGKGLTVAKLAF